MESVDLRSPEDEVIHEAARDGDLKRLREIKERIGNEDFRKRCNLVNDNDGELALHLAAKEGRIDICKFLIEEVKIAVNIRSVNWDNPLLLATYKEHVSIAKYLISHGAEVTTSDFGGFTSLHNLASNEGFDSGKKELMQLLLDKGADIEAISVSGTPLQFAAYYENIEAVQFLLENGAKSNSVCLHTGSPLIFAIMSKSSECVKLLLKVGADPNTSAFGFADFCHSPCANAEGEAEHVKSWLPPGVDPNLVYATHAAPNENLYGLSPLAHAAVACETEILHYLLEAGADPDSLSTDFLKPIEYAAWKRYHDGINILLPVTQRIPHYPDWSTEGIMDFFHSKEAEALRARAWKGYLELASKKGIDAIEKLDYSSAVKWYAQAIYLEPLNARWRTNRSLCWARLGETTFALSDARMAALLAPGLARSHFMEGLAWKLLKNHHKALLEFQVARTLDPQNGVIDMAYEWAVAEYIGCISGKSQSEAADEAACIVSLERMKLP